MRFPPFEAPTPRTKESSHRSRSVAPRPALGASPWSEVVICSTAPEPVEPFPLIYLIVGLGGAVLCLVCAMVAVWKTNLRKVIAPKLLRAFAVGPTHGPRAAALRVLQCKLSIALHCDNLGCNKQTIWEQKAFSCFIALVLVEFPHCIIVMSLILGAIGFFAVW